MRVLLSLLIFLVSVIASAPALENRSHDPNLLDATLDELQAGLQHGRFTSVDLVKAYTARIGEVNSTLKAVTEINPDALSIAKMLDAERAAGHSRSPLHGIPILIKANIGTKDLLNTTAGSYALLGAKLPRDSTIAAKLRKAGAIILGKTNLSQWANFRSDLTSNGWSAYGGQTQGAYYPKQDPSGSSSGSGVSASLGLALACLGTETDGSIVSPSEVNNVVGIKPTVGLTSRYLVVPISQHQDTVGPMARTVKDAAYLLQAIAGRDKRDNYTSAIPSGGLPDYVAACDASSLKGARLGIPQNAIELYSNGKNSPVLRAFKRAVATMEKAGATIVESNFTALKEFSKSNNETIVLEADFVSDLFNYLSELSYNPKGVYDLQQVRKFTKNVPQEQFPKRDVKVWTASLELGYNNTDYRFWKAYQADLYLGGPGGLFGAINRNKLDAVILPTDFSSSFAAIVGAPIVTVPLGFYPNHTKVTMNQFGNLVETAPKIPFGLAFLGKSFSEASLISYAYAYEQMTMVRTQEKPYIIPKTQISDV